MKTLFWGLAALPAVLSQSTGTPTTASCTASLVTSLCSYQTPGPDFAVAIESRASCWDYCHAHPPCNFVIFSAGNPYTGTGTCWLYPGQTFSASKGSSCGTPSLFVYGEPVCAGGSTTTSSGGCAATATPSAVASVCGYPTPPGDCFDGCSASGGASDCLSQCAKADSCSYVVFNPHNSDASPYASGTCWMYPNGTYDAASAAKCSGAPEQYVYKNLCPKPSKPSKSSKPSQSSQSSQSSSAAGSADAEGAGAAPPATTTSESLAPTGLSGVSLGQPLAIGVAALAWHGL